MAVRGASPADFHQWPNAAGPANLPNASGSPTQSAALEQGDLCYDSNNGVLYWCLFATLGSAIWVPISTYTDPLLFRWNNGGTGQFAPASTLYGTPVNPALVSVTSATEANNHLLASMDVLSSADSAVVWWSNTIVGWQSMDISFFYSNDDVLPATDAFEIGVVMAGDAGASTCLFLGGGATSLSEYVYNGTGIAPTLVKSVTLSASGANERKVQVSLNAATIDPAGFPPFGVPAFVGTAGGIGVTTPASEAAIFRASSGDFVAPPWGTTSTNRIGIALRAPAGVADPGGLHVRLWGLQYSQNRVALP